MTSASSALHTDPAALGDWVRSRDGLGDLRTRLGVEDCRIAYLGASVTAQKEGFRPLLHDRLVADSGRAHVPIAAGTGGVGSVSGVFTMDRLVLRHRPHLCLIEYSTGDTEPHQAPEALIGPAVEGMIRKLGDIDCAVCLVHLYRRDQLFDPPNRAVREHERVADHYGVPSIDVGRYVEAGIRDGRYDADLLFRDAVHTTDAGSRLTADLVARGLRAILGQGRSGVLDGSDAAVNAAAPRPPRPYLHPTHLHRTRVLPVTPDMLRHPAAHGRGRYRWFYDYLQIDCDNAVECRLDGELVGIMVVVGRDAGIVEVSGPDGSREHALWDPACFYDRYTTAIFDPPFTAGTPVTIRLTDKAVDYSTCRRPLENVDRIDKTLRIIGLMMRGA